MTNHREKQIEIINTIAEQVRKNSLQATAVAPVADFERDDRICLTSVHFPKESFVNTVLTTITEPLAKLFPQAYCYPKESLHFTIKNIRVIANPPSFTEEQVDRAFQLYEKVIPTHKSFRIYPHRLLVFKNNLALICTTDEELDNLILDLDDKLKEVGIPDNKRYANSRYFFCNMTLMRFAATPPQAFLVKVDELSNTLPLLEYTVDSVELLTGNAAMKKLRIRGEWKLTG